ncbi:hypothetical protein MRB53_024695 [Persea americana]|uniref:Uncharacterized protein n=1 Tax=Persea americana TaxID=3435 RepID=A0ACC2LDC4_PERAE|nr:hypothetical protein MRB53_024695 [Persea americana]
MWSFPFFRRLLLQSRERESDVKIIIRKRKQFLEAFIFEYAGIVGIFRLLLWRWGRLACIISLLMHLW